MKIKNVQGEFTKAEVFNMTQGGTVAKISEHAGEVLELGGWILYEDENTEGCTQEVLALKEKNGLISATISPTFIKQFKKALEFMGDEAFNIKVVTGTSKSNRTYVTCELV